MPPFVVRPSRPHFFDRCGIVRAGRPHHKVVSCSDEYYWAPSATTNGNSMKLSKPGAW